MGHVFLSYSRRDGPYVDRLAEHLNSLGYRTWVDRNGINGGQQWRREIVGAIKAADLFVLFLSPNSVRSDNVRKEIDLAEEARLRILPVTIAPIELPDGMKYQLAGTQIVELWRDPDRAVIRLAQSVRSQGVQRDKQPEQQPKRAALAGGDSNLDLANLGGGKLIEALSRVRLFRRTPTK